MTAFICICSEEYLGYYNVLYESLKLFAPEHRQILYFIGEKVPKQFDEVINITEWYNNCNPSYNKLEKICSLRARVVLDAFDEGFDEVVFLGAKVQFFDYPSEMIDKLKEYNAVVTPHILQPLPEDDKFPSNATVSFTGHISTDVVGFRNTYTTANFLKWQDEIMVNNCKTTNNTYLDQSWLNFLPFFVEDVHILVNAEYNVAYWNYKQRNLHLKNNKWYVEDYGRMVCFQFSGIDLNNPKTISTHQNRYEAEGDFLSFLKGYATRVKEYKCE